MNIIFYREHLNKNPYYAYPMPKYLRSHITKHDSINFQVIGGRGKGKSTMIRHLLELENKADDGNKDLPEAGSSDTTREPHLIILEEFTFGICLA